MSDTIKMSPEEIEDRDTAQAFLREQDISPGFAVASGVNPGVMFIYMGLQWDEDGIVTILKMNNPPDGQRDRLFAIHWSHLRLWKGYDDEPESP